MSLEQKKVAIVTDWLVDFGGAERVLECFLEIFPQADIYSSVCHLKTDFLEGKKITTTYIQKLPFFSTHHKHALTLRPTAFESLDLREYDIVISSSTAESKGVITKPETLHICYCHTPVRYFWSHYHEYLQMLEFGILNPLVRWVMPKVIHTLRQWDYIAAQRPDFYIANSSTTAKRIKKYYNRESEVIHPGINLDDFSLKQEKKDYYFYAGRCIPYKRFDIVIEAFNKNKKNIILATNTENSLQKKLEKISGPNITWVKNPSKEELIRLYGEAKAFLFPPEEDFGIAPIEAQACGTPVIAYRTGGATETIIENETGIFFESQTTIALNKAIEVFETMNFSPIRCREQAMRFNREDFKKEILRFIEEKYAV